MTIRTRPVTAETWPDLQAVLGPRGGSAGCWCTFWRMTNQEAARSTGADHNKKLLSAAVCSGEPAGVVAYRQDGEPVGWCSVAPRDTFKRVARTKGLAPKDPEEPGVWSVVCLFVREEARGTGVSAALLDGAVAYAKQSGATVLESYPVLVADERRKSVMSSGTVDQYTKAGFDLYSEPAGANRRIIMRHGLA